MSKCCSVFGCYNSMAHPECLESGISFHPFPRHNKELLKNWLEFINLENFVLYDHSAICSDHFDDWQFEVAQNSKGRRLKYDAVPALYPFGKQMASEDQMLDDLPEGESGVGKRHCSDLWDRRGRIKLLKLIKQYWHIVSERHYHRKPSLWIKIAKELQENDVTVTPHQCLMKWKKMKKAYRLNLRRQKQAAESGVKLSKHEKSSSIDEMEAILPEEFIQEMEDSVTGDDKLDFNVTTSQDSNDAAETQLSSFIESPEKWERNIPAAFSGGTPAGSSTAAEYVVLNEDAEVIEYVLTDEMVPMYILQEGEDDENVDDEPQPTESGLDWTGEMELDYMELIKENWSILGPELTSSASQTEAVARVVWNGIAQKLLSQYPGCNAEFCLAKWNKLKGDFMRVFIAMGKIFRYVMKDRFFPYFELISKEKCALKEKYFDAFRAYKLQKDVEDGTTPARPDSSYLKDLKFWDAETEELFVNLLKDNMFYSDTAKAKKLNWNNIYAQIRQHKPELTMTQCRNKFSNKEARYKTKVAALNELQGEVENIPYFDELFYLHTGIKVTPDEDAGEDQTDSDANEDVTSKVTDISTEGNKSDLDASISEKKYRPKEPEMKSKTAFVKPSQDSLWTDKMMDELFALVRQNWHILKKYESPGHENDLKDLWVDIAKKLSEKHHNCSWGDCMNAWDKMKHNFLVKFEPMEKQFKSIMNDELFFAMESFCGKKSSLLDKYFKIYQSHYPQDSLENDAASSSSGNSGRRRSSTWNSKAERLLLRYAKQEVYYNKRLHRMVRDWKTIHEKLKPYKRGVTVAQCRVKIRDMKVKYLKRLKLFTELEKKLQKEKHFDDMFSLHMDVRFVCGKNSEKRLTKSEESKENSVNDTEDFSLALSDSDQGRQTPHLREEGEEIAMPRSDCTADNKACRSNAEGSVNAKVIHVESGAEVVSDYSCEDEENEEQVVVINGDQVEQTESGEAEGNDAVKNTDESDSEAEEGTEEHCDSNDKSDINEEHDKDEEVEEDVSSGEESVNNKKDVKREDEEFAGEKIEKREGYGQESYAYDTKTKDEQFVMILRNYWEELHDDSTYKNGIWRRFAEEYEVYHPGCSGDYCSRKWSRLKSRFKKVFQNMEKTFISIMKNDCFFDIMSICRGKSYLLNKYYKAYTAYKHKMDEEDFSLRSGFDTSFESKVDNRWNTEMRRMLIETVKKLPGGRKRIKRIKWAVVSHKMKKLKRDLTPRKCCCKFKDMKVGYRTKMKELNELKAAIDKVAGFEVWLCLHLGIDCECKSATVKSSANPDNDAAKSNRSVGDKKKQEYSEDIGEKESEGADSTYASDATWDIEARDLLLAQVDQYWDYLMGVITHGKNGRKIKKKDVWDVIAAELQLQYPNITAMHCLSKWKGMRRYYIKLLKEGKLDTDGQKLDYIDQVHQLYQNHRVNALYGPVDDESFSFPHDSLGMLDKNSSSASPQTLRGAICSESAADDTCKVENGSVEEKTSEGDCISVLTGQDVLWDSTNRTRLMNLMKRHWPDCASGSISKLELWKRIAEELQPCKPGITHQQCRDKWVGMKRTYLIYMHQLKTNPDNTSVRKLPYFHELEEVFEVCSGGKQQAQKNKDLLKPKSQTRSSECGDDGAELGGSQEDSAAVQFTLEEASRRKADSTTGAVKRPSFVTETSSASVSHIENVEQTGQSPRTSSAPASSCTSKSRQSVKRKNLEGVLDNLVNCQRGYVEAMSRNHRQLCERLDQILQLTLKSIDERNEVLLQLLDMGNSSKCRRTDSSDNELETDKQ